MIVCVLVFTIFQNNIRNLKWVATSTLRAVIFFCSLDCGLVLITSEWRQTKTDIIDTPLGGMEWMQERLRIGQWQWLFLCPSMMFSTFLRLMCVCMYVVYLGWWLGRLLIPPGRELVVLQSLRVCVVYSNVWRNQWVAPNLAYDTRPP